ncbi:MAG: PEP-CTERM sorting domain-containing protein [Pseudomonadota bacterium]
MSMKMKALAAAVALTAVAGPASAALLKSSTGNSDMMFVVMDYAGTPDDFSDDRSYSRDLGIGMNYFSSGTLPPVFNSALSAPGYNLTFTPDQTFLDFLAGTKPADVSALRWNVAGSDANGPDRAMTTITALPGLPTLTEFRQWSAGYDATAGYQNAIGTHPTSAEGSAIATAADGYALATRYWGDNWNGRTKDIITTAKMGESADFYVLWEKVASGNNVAKPEIQQYTGFNNQPLKWTLQNDGDLVLAPVPEAETWAMMAAGLLLVGAAARRRMAV